MAFVVLITNLRFLQPPLCGIRTSDNQTASCSHRHVAFVLLITNLRFLQPPLCGSHRHVAFVLLITNFRILQPPSCGIRTLDNQPPPPPSFPTSCCCTLLSIPDASAFLPSCSSPTSCLLQAVQFFGVFGAELQKKEEEEFLSLFWVCCWWRVHSVTPLFVKIPFLFFPFNAEGIHCPCMCVFSHACCTIYNI